MSELLGGDARFHELMMRLRKTGVGHSISASEWEEIEMFIWETFPAEIKQLKKQLPEGMEDCTILLKRCTQGHTWLTAMNWLQHECPWCQIAQLKAEIEKLKSTDALVIERDTANALLKLQGELMSKVNEQLVKKYAKAHFHGIEWFACWLLDNKEGETITEEQLQEWVAAAWEAYTKV